MIVRRLQVSAEERAYRGSRAIEVEDYRAEKAVWKHRLILELLDLDWPFTKY